MHRGTISEIGLKLKVEMSGIFEALQTSSAQKQCPLWLSSMILWNFPWMWSNDPLDPYVLVMHCAHYRYNSRTKAEWSSKPILSHAKSLLFMHCHMRDNRVHNGFGWLCEHFTHWDRDKMAVIFQTTFSNAFFWMKMNEFRLRFHWNLLPRVKLTIFHHCFR